MVVVEAAPADVGVVDVNVGASVDVNADVDADAGVGAADAAAEVAVEHAGMRTGPDNSYCRDQTVAASPRDVMSGSTWRLDELVLKARVCRCHQEMRWETKTRLVDLFMRQG